MPYIPYATFVVYVSHSHSPGEAARCLYWCWTAGPGQLLPPLLRCPISVLAPAVGGTEKPYLQRGKGDHYAMGIQNTIFGRGHKTTPQWGIEPPLKQPRVVLCPLLWGI